MVSAVFRPEAELTPPTNNTNNMLMGVPSTW